MQIYAFLLMITHTVHKYVAYSNNFFFLLARPSRRLFLQNHWANYNQTWNKAFLSEGSSNCFTHNSEIVEIL